MKDAQRFFQDPHANKINSTCKEGKIKAAIRFGLMIYLILGLMLLAIPASAEASRTEVNGKFFFVGEPAEHPKASLWTTGQYVDHCRYDIQLFQFDTDYEALNGWGQGLTRCEFHYKPDFSLMFAHIWGTTKITSDLEGENVLWECTGNGMIDEQWQFSLDYVCHGRNENEGLFARLFVASMVYDDEVGWYYPLSGEVLEVGGY